MSEVNLKYAVSSYVGLGSRVIPPEYQSACRHVAYVAAMYHVILRTNTNAGTSAVFEDSCFRCQGTRQIYLPYEGFNKRRHGVSALTGEHYEVASRAHPNWSACNQCAKKIHANTVSMLLGDNLNDKAGVLLTYTEKGIAQGSSGFAIHLAKGYDIPIINAGKHTPSEFINLCTVLIRDGIYVEE